MLLLVEAAHDENGKLITTSVKEYTKQGIIKSYRTLDSFLQTWNEADKKKIIIEIHV